MWNENNYKVWLLQGSTTNSRAVIIFFFFFWVWFWFCSCFQISLKNKKK